VNNSYWKSLDDVSHGSSTPPVTRQVSCEVTGSFLPQLLRVNLIKPVPVSIHPIVSK